MRPRGVAHLSLERWQAACDAVGAHGAEREHRKLLRAWRSWGRHYHTLEHLSACLRELDAARSLARAPAEVELALWFHDAIYRTYRSDNEVRRAQWAASFLRAHGAAPAAAERIASYVLATRHDGAPPPGDAALVVDIDLAILGQPDDVYDAFERNVRKEYWWVPRRRYAEARARILASLLRRTPLYHRRRFRERYEAPARRSLERAVAGLTSQ
jgi:predicted metal-dependent HD superfamily phosphohydrolase